MPGPGADFLPGTGQGFAVGLRGQLDGALLPLGMVQRMLLEMGPLRIFAERGVATVNGAQGITFSLQDGRIQEVDATDPSRWVYTSFKDYQLFIPLAGSQAASERALEEMDNIQLRAQRTQA